MEPSCSDSIQFYIIQPEQPTTQNSLEKIYTDSSQRLNKPKYSKFLARCRLNIYITRTTKSNILSSNAHLDSFQVTNFGNSVSSVFSKPVVAFTLSQPTSIKNVSYFCINSNYLLKLFHSKPAHFSKLCFLRSPVFIISLTSQVVVTDVTKEVSP